MNNTVKLNSKELRVISEEDVKLAAQELERNPIYLIVENVYDTYNVGGLFRLADALAVTKLYLVGETETPPNGRILKASCGTYKVVPWAYKETVVEAIAEIRRDLSRHSGLDPESSTRKFEILNPVQDDSTVTDHNLLSIAIEQGEGSVPHFKIPYEVGKPVAFVVGNETYGVTKEATAACDILAEIPMWGINKSLNVIVSAAIVTYDYASRSLQK